jgi:glutamate/aspartate transport system permease protein
MLQFDSATILDNLPYLMAGLRLSLLITAAATTGGLLFGTLLALLRLSPFAVLSRIGLGYILFFRSMPLLLILFWFFFLVPLLVGHSITGITCALISFICFEAAYFCEIVRAGIQSVSRGLQNAGLSIGLRWYQVFFHIVLPIAARNMLPVLVTQVIIIFQDTSVLSILSLNDFTSNAGIVVGRDGHIVEVYLFVAVVYLCLCSGASTLARFYCKRVAV